MTVENNPGFSSRQALPPHYRRFYNRFIRFSCVMIFFALIAGILFQESTRKVSFDSIAPGIHWEAVYHLALLHGHAFLIGVLLPLAILVMLHLVLQLGGKTLSAKTLHWGGLLYQLGAISAILLMLYKGYHYVLSVRMGTLDFAFIHHSFFAGQEILRHVIYGLSHVAMSVGLGIFAVAIWRALPKPSDELSDG
ncbi:MAG: DUF2871 family protein [Vampirovibrionales bacterium]|nr:DUF2871 family protein [Vampirovibrionales bacterium]